MSNIIRAKFHDELSNQLITEPIYQYDYGQILDLSVIEDLPSVFEVHFCNKNGAEATVSIGQDGQVSVPDTYLQSGEYIYAYIYLHTGESDGATEYKVSMPVAKRQTFTHEEPTPVQQSEIEQLMAALEDIIEHGKTGLPENVVRPEDYGAKGDGETDDTEAFRQALDSGKVVFADGTYLFGSESSAGRVIVEKNATLICTPRTRLIRGDVSGGNQSGFFMVSGTQVAESALTSDASEGSQVISVEDASVFAVGDFVALRNGGTGAELSKRLTTRVREVSGNTVRLENDLQWDYTAENAKLVKYAPLTFRAYGNGAVIDGDEHGKTRSANSQRYGFWLQYNDGSVIEGFRVENSVSGIARLDHCLGCLIDECEGTTPARIDTPYGEFASIAFCTSCIVRGTRTYGYRRSVDWIGAYLCRAERCTASNGGFSAHGYLAKRCTFANCVSDMRNTSAPDDYPKNTVGNETYYFDQEITYDGCTFIDQKYQMQVMRNCSANVIDCEFISTTQDGNGGSIRCASEGAVVRVQGSRFKTKGYCVTVANGTAENPSMAECRDCVFELVGKGNDRGGFSGYANSRLVLYDCIIRGDAPAIGPVDSARPFLKAYGCRFENEPNAEYYDDGRQTVACSGSEYVDCTFTRQAALAYDASNVSFLNCTFETVPDTLDFELNPTDRNIRVIGCRHKSALGVQENLPYNILVRDNIQTELPDGTATGTTALSPANIPDGAADAPVLELTVTLSAKQAGTGTPSTSNVRPITGFTGVGVSYSGKDTLDAETLTYDWSQLAGTVYGGVLDVKNGTLTATRGGMVFDGSEDWKPQGSGSGLFYLLGEINNDIPSSRACSHFANYSIYGGNTMAGYRASPVGDVRIRPGADIAATLAEWKAWLSEQYQNGTPVTAWWTLDDPVVYELTAADVRTVLGENHIWASDGEVFVRYRRDPQWNVCYVPPGGTDGQVLAKASDDDFDLEWISGGGGTTDYTDLSNKPSVNGHTLQGNQTARDLGIIPVGADDVDWTGGNLGQAIPPENAEEAIEAVYDQIPNVPVQSVNGKTGAVVLDASDVGAVDLNDLPYNLGAALTFVKDGIRATNGETYNSNTVYHTDYVDVSGFAAIVYTRLKTENSTSTYCSVAFYDEDKTFVSAIRPIYNDVAGTALEHAEIPSGAVYARFCMFDSNRTSFRLYDESQYSTALKLMGIAEAGSGGTGGTSDYDQLSNRPQINGNTLTGNLTAAQLGLGTYSKPSGGIPASDLASGVIPTVPSAATADPENLGTKAVGTSTKYAREDHVHQMPSASDVGAVAAPSSPSSGDVLTYNGGAWNAAAPAREVFVCTYNSTTSAEIEAAYQAGKICVVTYNSKLFQLVYRGNATSHTFACFIDSSATTGQNVSCSSDSWTAATAHELLRAPSSPSVGDFLVYGANGWTAQTLAVWQGGSY